MAASTSSRGPASYHSGTHKHSHQAHSVATKTQKKTEVKVPLPVQIERHLADLRENEEEDQFFDAAKSMKITAKGNIFNAYVRLQTTQLQRASERLQLFVDGYDIPLPHDHGWIRLGEEYEDGEVVRTGSPSVVGEKGQTNKQVVANIKGSMIQLENYEAALQALLQRARDSDAYAEEVLEALHECEEESIGEWKIRVQDVKLREEATDHERMKAVVLRALKKSRRKVDSVSGEQGTHLDQVGRMLTLVHDRRKALFRRNPKYFSSRQDLGSLSGRDILRDGEPLGSRLDKLEAELSAYVEGEKHEGHRLDVAERTRKAQVQSSDEAMSRFAAAVNSTEADSPAGAEKAVVLGRALIDSMEKERANLSQVLDEMKSTIEARTKALGASTDQKKRSRSISPRRPAPTGPGRRVQSRNSKRETEVGTEEVTPPEVQAGKGTMLSQLTEQLRNQLKEYVSLERDLTSNFRMQAAKQKFSYDEHLKAHEDLMDDLYKEAERLEWERDKWRKQAEAGRVREGASSPLKVVRDSNKVENKLASMRTDRDKYKSLYEQVRVARDVKVPVKSSQVRDLEQKLREVTEQRDKFQWLFEREKLSNQRGPGQPLRKPRPRHLPPVERESSDGHATTSEPPSSR